MLKGKWEALDFGDKRQTVDQLICWKKLRDSREETFWAHGKFQTLTLGSIP